MQFQYLISTWLQPGDKVRSPINGFGLSHAFMITWLKPRANEVNFIFALLRAPSAVESHANAR